MGSVSMNQIIWEERSGMEKELCPALMQLSILIFVSSRVGLFDATTIGSAEATNQCKQLYHGSSRWSSPPGTSRCGSSKAKNVDLASFNNERSSGFLLAQGKNCLARGQGKLRNSADMQASG